MELFKPIQPGEDHRFCDLVNLVRRSFNILKEVKRPQDIDNIHVLYLIERKLTRDDLKIWARHINSQKARHLHAQPSQLDGKRNDSSPTFRRYNTKGRLITSLDGASHWFQRPCRGTRTSKRCRRRTARPTRQANVVLRL